MDALPRYDEKMDDVALRKWARRAQAALDEAAAEIAMLDDLGNNMRTHAIGLTAQLMRMRMRDEISDFPVFPKAKRMPGVGI